MDRSIGQHVIITNDANSFVERRGGWIIAVCLHVMFFSLMQITQQRTVIDSPLKPQALKVRLVQSEPAPAPTPPPAVATARAIEPAARTVAASEVASDTESADTSAKATDAAPGADASTLNNPQSPLVDDSDADFQPDAWEVFGDSGSDAVALQIRLARADLIAQQTLFSSSGVDEGVLRTLEIRDVPRDVAEQVLEQYGIRTIVAHVDKPASELSYLNQASTHQGTFVSAAGRGVYEVFTIGGAAMARMAQLEEAAIAERGLDPKASRVESVVFGIVNTTEGWDLGVKRIEVKPVKGLEKEKKPVN